MINISFFPLREDCWFLTSWKIKIQPVVKTLSLTPLERFTLHLWTWKGPHFTCTYSENLPQLPSLWTAVKEFITEQFITFLQRISQHCTHKIYTRWPLWILLLIYFCLFHTTVNENFFQLDGLVYIWVFLLCVSTLPLSHDGFYFLSVVPPAIHEMRSHGVRPGQIALLRCEAAAVPSPVFEWYKGEKR